MLSRLSVVCVVMLLGCVPAIARAPVREVRLVAVPGDDEQPFRFEPARLAISPGTTVRWTNTQDVFHTVTFTDSFERRTSNGTFDRSLAAARATAERTFGRPGSHFYFCQPHSAFMAATIIVTPAGGRSLRRVSPVAGAAMAVAVITAALSLAAWRGLAFRKHRDAALAVTELTANYSLKEIDR